MKIAYERNWGRTRRQVETSSRDPSGEEQGADAEDYKAGVGRQATRDDRDVLEGRHKLSGEVELKKNFCAGSFKVGGICLGGKEGGEKGAVMDRISSRATRSPLRLVPGIHESNSGATMDAKIEAIGEPCRLERAPLMRQV